MTLKIFGLGMTDRKLNLMIGGQNVSKDISDSKEQRLELFSEYYGVSLQIMNMFCNYTRYFEAQAIVDELGEREIKALDFGCGVGDYGMGFLRNGWQADFYDKKMMLDFVEARLKNEKFEAKLIEILESSKDYVNMIGRGKYNLVVFGEVLEHMDDAYEALEACIDNEVTFIFTSSYPFIKEDGVFHRRGHSEKAGQDREKCQALLTKYYDYKTFEGELRLWSIRKPKGE